MSAVNDYLNKEGSLQDICIKYKIRSHKQLIDWIKVYNSGGILKTSTGGAYMRKAKKTTLDERLKIVTDCLANDKIMVQWHLNMVVPINKFVIG